MSRVKALNRDGKITWCTAKTPGQRNFMYYIKEPE